jgi:MerR family transcriptional regulator, redox-sensitive transcriptional activator SoxR
MAQKPSTLERPLAIGELAARSGVPATTIRYYEREGILPEPDRVAGRRRYEPEVEQRLAAIKLAKEAGFSLREIERFVSGFSPSTPPSVRWRQMAGEKLTELDRKAEEIERMRSVLQRGLACDCLTLDDCELLPLD